MIIAPTESVSPMAPYCAMRSKLVMSTILDLGECQVDGTVMLTIKGVFSEA